MSRQCYVARCLDSIFFTSAISRIMTFYKSTRDMLVQSYFQRLCLVDKLIVLLKENSARDPEFDYDHSELADMDNSECKANSILKT